MAVALQGEPSRMRQLRRARDRPGRVDRHDAVGRRDGDEETIAVGREGPVLADAGERHERQQPCPAEAETRVDDGDRGIVVQGDDVKLIQVELGRSERVAAGEAGDLAGQGPGVARLALRARGEPRGGLGTGDRPPGRGVGDPDRKVTSSPTRRVPAGRSSRARSARGPRRWRSPRG